MSSIVNKGTMAPDHAGPLAVVKIGGGLTATPGLLPRVGEAIAQAAVRHTLVVLPGGGPFADQVRAFDRLHRLSADAAHWMAILGMDQYAVALSDVIPRARLVEEPAGVRLAHGEGMVPVLAPARWLRAADELPHSWDVTSDSLAAYLATLLGADTLVLVKPVSGGAELMDPWFTRTMPAGMRWSVLAAGEIERLEEVLEGEPRSGGGNSTPLR
jgi:aspartokinase-like uncharacterized kinase